MSSYDIILLLDHMDKFFPDCTLCNDKDYWENGMLCLCNNEFALHQGMIPNGKTISWSDAGDPNKW